MFAVDNNSMNYKLNNGEYKKLAEIVYNCAGIDLGDNKKELVHARLSKILRKRKISGFQEYISMLRTDKTGDELVLLLDAISTNVTHFFREKEHFNFLIENICPHKCSGNFHFWSAGCSSGEEPYTIAITLREYLMKSASSIPHILATDLSTKVLGKAIAGIYPMKAVENLDISLVKKYFLKGSGSSAGSIKIKKEIAKMVTFERLNLIEPLPFRQEFDVIFCRNVMIYFDNETRQKIVNGFYNALKPEGYLIIGHSESLNGIKHMFKYIKPTIYRKP
ncbi:MAG: protein-glutamate O-methyltransferase [Candidatus Latescibacteria bacterium]|nr:protein-glutamate O-methyltransferase [Candidatus Latescibacterota bacterium]